MCFQDHSNSLLTHMNVELNIPNQGVFQLYCIFTSIMLIGEGCDYILAIAFDNT